MIKFIRKLPDNSPSVLFIPDTIPYDLFVDGNDRVCIDLVNFKDNYHCLYSAEDFGRARAEKIHAMIYAVILAGEKTIDMQKILNKTA